MQRRHDVGHRGVVALAEVEVGARGAGAVDKQRHRRVEGMVLQGRAGFRQGQRGQGVFDFAVQPQRAARRDQQVQLRQPLQPARDVCARGFHELLEVVQHQQHAAAGQRAFDTRRVVGGGAVAVGLHGTHHGVVHLRCRAAGRQRHEGDKVEHRAGCSRCEGQPGGTLGQRTGHFDGQAGLAATARAAQHHQAALRHGGGQRSAVGFETDQARQVLRQAHVLRGSVRRGRQHRAG